ncbi:MAG: 16S rRNA (guanine(966)-N(2))-methyltransferase RsmD [Bacteroidota bacterium]
MRIISGQYRGKRITAPKKLPVRPTTDMAKEALFNILNNYFHFEEVSVIDLYAGTGNLSYEFASRGAKQIFAIDANAACVAFILKTARELDLNITPIKADVLKYLEKSRAQADIVFADPPYDMALADFEAITFLVFKKQLLAKNGMLVIEHSKHMDLSYLAHFSEQRSYGGSAFSFFQE